MKMLEKKRDIIKKFIFASTCSVYGVSKHNKVTETHPLKPITEYNKYKVKAVKKFNHFKKNFSWYYY